MESVPHNLMHILSKVSGVDKSKINFDTTLGRDLGLDGLDAYEVMKKIDSEYGLSADDFPFEEYFGPENDFWGILRFFKGEKVQDKPLTVGQIILSINAKRWLLD